MKISVVSFALIISGLCVSCKTTEVPKTTQSKLDSRIIEAINPIKLKPGAIICHEQSELKIWDKKSAYCSTKKSYLYEAGNHNIFQVNRIITCPGVIAKISKTTGICNITD
jgi:hypothetical protein